MKRYIRWLAAAALVALTLACQLEPPALEFDQAPVLGARVDRPVELGFCRAPVPGASRRTDCLSSRDRRSAFFDRSPFPPPSA